jgi:RNA polymerase sigma-70 factor (ECF subfamily)
MIEDASQLIESERQSFDESASDEAYDEGSAVLLLEDPSGDADADADADDDDEHDSGTPAEQTETSATTLPAFVPIRTLSVLDNPDDLPPFQLDQEKLFKSLIDQHQRRLYRFVIKYIDHPDDAADITQQAFAEAARTIASFRGDSKLSTWLFGIAMNMVRNYLSRAPHRVHKFETDEVLTTIASCEPDPSDCLIQKELLCLAEKAFSDLPEEMSEVLGLVAVDEISYQDAADILDIPLGTVRSRVSRARAVLRANFELAGIRLQF